MMLQLYQATKISFYKEVEEKNRINQMREGRKEEQEESYRFAPLLDCLA